ncbi:MAG TPA: hypothetical protein ENG05_03745, partial [Acidilobales archaeon]|nr:hypothetical protein [Acidilobales archaeon]
ELQSIQLLFRDFLRMFKDDKGNFKYMERIRDMIINEKRSLQIDYEDLIRFNPKLIDIIEENPDLALQAFSESIKDIVAQEAPDYAEKVPKFYARLNGWVKITPIRGIRSEHVNKLVAIEGIIVRATPPKQKLYKARFVHILPNGEQHEFDWPPGPNEEMGDEIEKPSYCPVCVASMSEEEGRRGKGVFKLIIEKSKFRDYQLIVVQERPEEVPAGQIPRSIEVTLTDDIVDIARPGDRVTIIGVVRLAKGPRRGVKPIFNVYIEANNIIVAQRLLEELKLSPEDEEKIRELGKDPLIRRKIIASIAPTIYGMWDIKEAVALLLFGGVPKIAPDGTKIRGEIHVLLVGDPGTAKSLCFSEPILLLDKSGRIRFRPIGEVVDEYMRKYRAYVRRSKDTEVLNLNEVGEELYTISISPSTLQPEIKRVRALIRHKAPQEVLVVRTKTGRITVITEDHSLVAYDGRKLRPVKPDEAFKNKFLIPILTRIPLSTKRSLIHEVMVGRRKVPLDIDFGYLVGCFIGNGAVIKATAEEKVEIRTTDFNVAKRLVRIVKDKLSVKAKVYVRKTSRRRLWKISINDQDIVKWFKSNLYDNIRCKRRSKHLVKCKVIPEFAYNAPK